MYTPLSPSLPHRSLPSLPAPYACFSGKDITTPAQSECWKATSTALCRSSGIYGAPAVIKVMGLYSACDTAKSNSLPSYLLPAQNLTRPILSKSPQGIQPDQALYWSTASARKWGTCSNCSGLAEYRARRPSASWNACRRYGRHPASSLCAHTSSSAALCSPRWKYSMLQSIACIGHYSNLTILYLHDANCSGVGRMTLVYICLAKSQWKRGQLFNSNFSFNRSRGVGG